jgi:hypothetical protein
MHSSPNADNARVAEVKVFTDDTLEAMSATERLLAEKQRSS